MMKSELLDPDLWSKLPFEIISKIIRIECERHEEAKQIWTSKIRSVNELFTEMCEETYWNYCDEDPDPQETLSMIGFHNRIEWRFIKYGRNISQYDRTCKYNPGLVQHLFGGEPVLFPHYHIRSCFYNGEVPSRTLSSTTS